MFERYTEQARRVIFFARFEASQYGSSYIETEHILLGLMREDAALRTRFLGPTTTVADIRNEIERRITRGKRISTSVEVPLSQESKKVLVLAAEEAERLGDRHIGPEHMLVAMLGVKGSLAAKLLLERGLKAPAIREQLAKAPVSRASGPLTLCADTKPSVGEITTVESFLAALKGNTWEDLATFFAPTAQFVDCTGRRWVGREEIAKQFQMLFAPYSKKNVTSVYENNYQGPGECRVASILWENVTFGGDATRLMHRMTVVLASEGEDWVIFLLQVTPVVSG